MDLPEQYYIGKEFVEDQETVEVVIDIFFYSPALLEPFELFVSGKKMTGTQQTNLLHITFEQAISKRLLDILKNEQAKNSVIGEFIIGYVSRYLPRINQEILRQRYSLGHFLVQTYSTLDICRINVIPRGTEEVIFVPWQPSITSFPSVKEFKGKCDEIHIRDFIDAGNSYLTADYDDCIRKVITSAENAFRFYGLRSNSPKGCRKYLQWLLSRQSNFVGIVQKNIYSDKYFGRQVVAENLIFIYKLRNKIVHDKFRIRFENGWICKKAIGTLNYLLQFLGQRGGFAEYVYYLSQQFIMLDNLLRGVNLDVMRARVESTDNMPTIDSFAQLDRFMFEGLRISEEEKGAVLRNRVPHSSNRK